MRNQVSTAKVESALAMLAEGDLIQIGGAGWWRFHSTLRRNTQWSRRVHTRTLRYLAAEGLVAMTRRRGVNFATMVPR